MLNNLLLNFILLFFVLQLMRAHALESDINFLILISSKLRRVNFKTLIKFLLICIAH